MTAGIFLALLLSFIWFLRRSADRNTRRAGIALFLPALLFYTLYAVGCGGVGVPALLLLLTGGD